MTASDKKVEKILIEELQKARPDYSILSEEIGKIKNDESFTWIIDPIDGTSNFLHGIPHFAISVGLEHNNEIICGIIYDPIKDEMFTGEKGSVLKDFVEKFPEKKGYFELKSDVVKFKFPEPGPLENVKSMSKILLKMELMFFLELPLKVIGIPKL